MKYLIRKCPFASEIKDDLFDLVVKYVPGGHPGSSYGSQQTLWNQWQDVPQFMRLFEWINNTVIPEVITEFVPTTKNPRAYKVGEYWGMLYPDGDVATHEHCHSPAILSMGYYINYPEGSAPFIISRKLDKLENMILNTNRGVPTVENLAEGNVSITPEEGDLIIIKGDTCHAVPKGHNTEGRCMIALNSYIVPQFVNTFDVICPNCDYEDVIYELSSYGCPKCNTITPKEDLLIKCE